MPIPFAFPRFPQGAALALSCLSLACGRADVPPLAPPGDDDDAPGNGTADPDLPWMLALTPEPPDGLDGTVVVEITPAWDGGEARVFEVAAGETLAVRDLLPGPYGVLAWLDVDGDGAWDGIWGDDGGEPTARFGLRLPRVDLRVPLRAGVPRPVVDAEPTWVELYDAAWSMAAEHVARGTADNGFADAYMDEAFSEQIFQWDTCFMTLFGRHGLDSYPVMASLDNFYGSQAADGYICRVVNESDGLPGGDASDPSEPMINPPLFAWSELLYARQTGDLSRVPRVLPVLDAYAGWMDAHVRTGAGLYYTSLFGSGMDNSPREAAFDGWVDVTAQQALARRSIAELASLIGETHVAEYAAAEANRICADVRAQLWDPAQGFYADLGHEGEFLTDKTLAGVWPLVAGCATHTQAAAAVATLRDPATFWRVHPFPSVAADSPRYEADGHYWLGGVWAPTNYATVVALDAAGYPDVAAAATERQLDAMYRVYAEFAPPEERLAPEARGDGTYTLWELYAPDGYEAGTRYDDWFYGRQDFVGWSGLAPIGQLIEHAIGLRPYALDDTLTWRLTRIDRHGVEGYRFGEQLVDVVAAARDGADAPVTIDIEASDAFTLVVELGGRSHPFAVPRGSSTVEVDPAGAPLAVDPTPAGPFPGYAVVGNGSIAAVISEDDGSGDPPGIAHLYKDHFGLDLVEAGHVWMVRLDEAEAARRVGTEPFFAAYAESETSSGVRMGTRTFVGAEDAVLIRGTIQFGRLLESVGIQTWVRLREEAHIDGEVGPVEYGVDEDRRAGWARFDDGSVLALGCSGSELAEAGELDPSAWGLELPGAPAPGPALWVMLDTAGGGSWDDEFSFSVALAVGDSVDEALATLDAVLADPDPLATAQAHWADWAPDAACDDGHGPVTDACRVAAANLYAARASSLGGQVPADLTGQFVTHGYPQLYPRDALMTARAFQLAGHDDEAWEIVRDWLAGDREQPSPGEWYARYDALGRGVDAGSGAAYDVPEWDSNGYLAALVERLGPAQLGPAEQDVLLEALDFLVDTQDADGLWSEGGIVEWVGRLPATTMTSWVGLDAGARLAEGWGDDARAADYRAAAGRARGGLRRLLDLDRGILADERDGGLAYDTSMLFGPAWGYPADPLLDASLAWFLAEATDHGGGVRYFEGMGYGQDLFGFTTSASAQYAATIGDDEAAGELLDWMTAFTNRYGLVPERVYADGWGAAEASPLSWCAAELAVTVLALRAAAATDGIPAIDGAGRWAEWRRAGGCAVDRDGAADERADAVALCAARDGDELLLGVRLAGPADDVAGSPVHRIYLAGLAGEGSAEITDGGLPLRFRAAPGATPAAAARVELDLAAGSCAVGAGSDDGWDDTPCDALAIGERWVEARVDLDALGLAGDTVQAILATDLGGAAGESLLPAHGALRSDGADARVLLTFEVDASAVAHLLDPGAGVVVTLSGDRPELGDWLGNAIGLTDDGSGGDRVAGDDVWTVVVETDRDGAVAYKYLVGVPGDDQWSGVEFAGDDRVLPARDLDATGRVAVLDTFGTPAGSSVWDP